MRPLPGCRSRPTCSAAMRPRSGSVTWCAARLPCHHRHASSQSRCSRQRLPNGRVLRFEVRFGSQAEEFSAVSGGRQHGGIVQVNVDNLNGRAVILA